MLFIFQRWKHCCLFADDSVYLFVVNHPQQKSQVEIFHFVPENTLVHLKTITHALLHRYVRRYTEPLTASRMLHLTISDRDFELVRRVVQCEWRCCSRSRELLRYQSSSLCQWCAQCSDYPAGFLLVWCNILQSKRSEGGSRRHPVPQWHQHITWQTVILNSFQQLLWHWISFLRDMFSLRCKNNKTGMFLIFLLQVYLRFQYHGSCNQRLWEKRRGAITVP